MLLSVHLAWGQGAIWIGVGLKLHWADGTPSFTPLTHFVAHHCHNVVPLTLMLNFGIVSIHHSNLANGRTLHLSGSANGGASQTMKRECHPSPGDNLPCPPTLLAYKRLLVVSSYILT